MIATMLRLGCHLFLWNHKEVLYVVAFIGATHSFPLVLLKTDPLALFFPLYFIFCEVHFISFALLNHSTCNTNNNVNGISLSNWLSNLKKGKNQNSKHWKLKDFLRVTVIISSGWVYYWWIRLPDPLWEKASKILPEATKQPTG